MLEAMVKQKEAMKPARGLFRVVGLDDYEPPGKQLFAIGPDYTNRAAADAALAEWKKANEGGVAYVYEGT